MTFTESQEFLFYFSRINKRRAIFAVLYKIRFSGFFVMGKDNAEIPSILAESQAGDGVGSNKMNLSSSLSPHCITGCSTSAT